MRITPRYRKYQNKTKKKILLYFQWQNEKRGSFGILDDIGEGILEFILTGGGSCIMALSITI